MKLALVALVVCSATAGAQEEPLAEFWRRGHVRELLVSGIPDVSLEQWVADGVNCAMGVPPAEAHALGMRTRTWFTMNSINPRSFGDDLDVIRTMAAENRDGSLRRPYDPLFPTVANNYTACVNKPAWREFAAGVFRRMAEEQWDGTHIDYASHYEPCMCEYCRAAWRQFATARGLEATDLLALPDDARTRLHEREFRIRCVMDFLAMVRNEARALRPGFCTDGTWHQDSGTTYQWAYGRELPGGPHFDMMCIEGTTWGPFPPQSQQILWLKLAHALTDREIAMSVTYHLLSDETGARHHGRTSTDRTRVALCEIMSQGAVSWLGLGGPGTGNLLREHATMVREVYRTWAELEPELTSRRETGDIGILFSPRSFLTSGSSRQQLYALGQALMRDHVPFVLHSDVGLTAEKLGLCPATVVLDANALTDEGIAALVGYHAGGGRLLFVGDMPHYAADWSERVQVPELLTRPEGDEGVVRREVDGRPAWYALDDPMRAVTMGANQSVTLDQQEPAPLAIEGESKALGVSGSPDAGYSLYVDLTYQDGSNLWGQIATFPTGTHDWQFSRFVIEPDKPLKSANVHILLRGHSGTAWFRKVRFGPWDAEREEITQNLLGDGGWSPYGDGFQVEEIAGEGPTILLVAGGDSIRVTDMHEPAPEAQRAALELLAPVLPDAPMLSVEGEGSDQVYCDVALTDSGALLQLINYNARLHPELSEAEQQEADRTTPCENLRVRFRPPNGRAITGLTLVVPGQERQTLALDGEGFMLPRLDAYAAVIVALAQ